MGKHPTNIAKYPCLCKEMFHKKFHAYTGSTSMEMCVVYLVSFPKVETA